MSLYDFLGWVSILFWVWILLALGWVGELIGLGILVWWLIQLWKERNGNA